jgi:glycosyltransferase involved in cell wall biosynthesis
MKIAYLAQSYPPMISGAAIFSAQLAEAMARRGHQVLVIAASERDNPYVTLSGNLTVLRLRSVNNPLRVGQRLLLPTRRAVLRALVDFEPDLIHAHEPFHLGLTGVAYAAMAGIPTVFCIHALPVFVTSYLPDLYYLRKAVESLLWLYASRVLRKFSICVAATRTISDLVTSKTGIRPQTISYGLNLGTFTAAHPSQDKQSKLRQSLGIPGSIPILLHVGRLDKDKHVDRVIQSAAQTMQTTNAHLLIIGDGNEKPALMKLSQNLGVQDRVHFPGYVKVEQGLPELYHLGTLFVTASEIETQGIVLLEAAASGLPIVAVRATCIPEIVHDGRNGFLSEPGDLTGLACSMTKLVTDGRLAGQMGKVSRQLAKVHDQERSMDLYETLYMETLICNMIPAKRKEQKRVQPFIITLPNPKK